MQLRTITDCYSTIVWTELWMSIGPCLICSFIELELSYANKRLMYVGWNTSMRFILMSRIEILLLSRLFTMLHVPVVYNYWTLRTSLLEGALGLQSRVSLLAQNTADYAAFSSKIPRCRVKFHRPRRIGYCIPCILCTWYFRYQPFEWLLSYPDLSGAAITQQCYGTSATAVVVGLPLSMGSILCALCSLSKCIVYSTG